MGRIEDISDTEINDRISVLQSTNTLNNWAKTFVATPERIYTPSSVTDLQFIIEAARRSSVRVRAMGVWHSPSDLACCDEWVVIMTRMNSIEEIDKESRTVTVQSGTLLKDMNEALDKNGLAIPILGSISDQTIGGCLATATHGSGYNHRSMSSYVRSLSLLLSSGDIVLCSREQHADLFNASLCSLGATGVMLSVTMDVEEKFNLHEITMPMSFAEYTSSSSAWLDRWQAAPYVKAFWIPQARGISLMQSYKSFEKRIQKPSFSLSATIFSYLLQPLLLIKKYIPGIAPLVSNLAWRYLFSTHQQRIDKSYNVFNMDCGLLQYTTEWAVPMSGAYQCLLDLNDWLVNENDVDFPLEIRISKADDIFLSPANSHTAHKDESHFMWIGLIKYKPYNCRVRYRRIFRTFEDILRKYGGRAHWAKHSTQTPQEVGQKYRDLPKFMDVLNKYDADGMFRNPFIDRHLITEKDDSFRDFKHHQVEAYGF